MNAFPKIVVKLTDDANKDHLNGGPTCDVPGGGGFVPPTTPAFCNHCDCLFSNLQRSAQTASGSCQARLQDLYKKHSPWAKLDRFDRYKMTLALAQRHAGAYDHQQDGKPQAGLPAGWKTLKRAMMACIATKETGGDLEPMIISGGNCGGASYYAGMGQQSKSDFTESVTKGQSIYGITSVFRSAIPRYRSEAGAPNHSQNYNMLTVDPELQMEFMDYFLTSKLSDMIDKNGKVPKDYDLVENLAAWYNGSSAKASYALAVRACTYCTMTLLHKGVYGPDEANNCMGYANFSVCGELMAANRGVKFGCSTRGQRLDRNPGRKP